jgi:hypothetical protein
MRLIDCECKQCEHIEPDVLLRERDRHDNYVYPPCPKCGYTLSRVHLGTSAGVKADSIPGGLYIENALCHKDGTPRRFDSHTDLNRAAKAEGWTNHVEHQGSKSGDKSKHTQRFV